MKIFTQEFVDGVAKVLARLEPGDSYTRAQVCFKMGLPESYVAVIGMVTSLEPQFAKYESIKSRGYRLKKEAASTPFATQTVVVKVDEPVVSEPVLIAEESEIPNGAPEVVETSEAAA